MKNLGLIWLLTVASLFYGNPLAQAEQHRATHLGNPITRFAPPLHAPEDLRARFRDPQLQPDIIAILKQSGWPGNVDDIFRAAQTAEISDITLPVGTVMPFMSSRENGDPICLRNVTWAGQEPIPAYAFDFTSHGRHYRCITPKPCSNFFVEDAGPQPKPGLALECEVPARLPVILPVKIYLTVHNTGDAIEPAATLTLPVPAGTTVTNTTAGGIIGVDTVIWQIPHLAPNASQQVRATLVTPASGPLAFHSFASGTAGETAQSDCETALFDVHAILVEVVDLADPIEVGKNVTYVIKITNQGNATDTHIRLLCTLPASQVFVSGTGTTAVHSQDQTLTMDPLPALDGKAVATWTVMTKALTPADSRFKVEVTADQFTQPIHREESTQLY